MSRILRSFLALAILGCCTGSSNGDVLELTDGTKLDGKVFKEDAGVLWVKTLQRIEKVPAENVKSRTPGESAAERYDKLRAAASKDPVTVPALWDLYQFQKEHLAELPPETPKDNQRLLAKILKRDPNHAGAHTEMGDVEFEGQWTTPADMERMKAERAQEKLRVSWQSRLGIPVQIYEADHFLIVDNTEDKDLPGRGKLLDKTYDTLTQVLGLESLWKDKCIVTTVKNYDSFCRVVDNFAAEAKISPAIVAAAKDRNAGGLWRDLPYAFQVRWPSAGTESMWSAIVHNCAHVAIWTLWARQPARPWERQTPPAWIEEGLGAWTEIEVMGQQVSSCMGESAKPKNPPTGGTTDKDPRKKKTPKKNAESLREAANEYKERCRQAIENDEFPPMRQFLKYKVGDVGPPEEGGVLGLVTWLVRTDPEKFKELILAIAKGGKKVDDEYWRETYGFELIEDMEKKWRGWVMGEW